MKRIKIASLLFIICASLSTACNAVKSEGTSNTDRKTVATVKKPLKVEFEDLQKEIQKAHKEADATLIDKIYQSFQKLDYENEEWKTLKDGLKAYQWPSQKSDKEIVGGYLFYPQRDIEDILDSSHTIHLLKKRDIFWSVVYAAKFQHSLGKYFTSHILDSARNEFTFAERPVFLTSLYKEALHELSLSTNNSDACYLLGLSHTDFSEIGVSKFSPEKAMNFHLQSKDPKNQFRVLYLKAQYKVFPDAVEAKELIKFAKQHKFGPAYIEAAKRSKGEKKKIKYLEEAVKAGYAKALVDLAYIYKQSDDKLEEAKKTFMRAGDHGIAEGYIQKALLLIGRPQDIPSSALINLPHKHLEEAANLFLKAAHLKDYEGLDYLAALYLKLSVIDKPKREQHKKLVYKFLINGIKLGSLKCYDTLYREFPEKFDLVVNTYKRPPQEKLYLTIQDFLKK